MSRKLIRLLASCRRIVLLLALCATAALAWLYWRAPSLDALRPELKALLTEQWQLAELHLGRLSWRWAGQFRVRADDVTLVTRDGRVRLDHARLSVRLSPWTLLSGHAQPVGLRVRGGAMRLRLSEAFSGKADDAFLVALSALPSTRFDIEDTVLLLEQGKETWRLPGFRLHLDGVKRQAFIGASGIRLDASWNETRTAVSLFARIQDLRWLPSRARRWIEGDASGEWRAEGTLADGEWRIQARLEARGDRPVRIRQGDEALVFDKLGFRGRIRGRNPLHPETVIWEQADWALGKERLKLRGDWKDGLLHARILDGAASLPALAGWSGRFATPGWRAWLARIKHGAMDHIEAELTLPQTNPWLAPAMRHGLRQEWKLEAELHDADAPLSANAGVITHLNGRMSASESGLMLEVRRAVLPKDAGTLNGFVKLTNWQQPVLNIKGQGEVDLARFQRWRGMPLPDAWQWRQSPALARFSLRWPTRARNPDQGWVELSPNVAWEGSFMGRSIRLSGGVLRWQIDAHSTRQRIAMRNMTIQYDTYAGRLDVAVHEGRQGHWALDSLRLQARASFADLVRRWRLPLDEPRGAARAELRFDGEWRLNLDLTEAGWRHFLGADKKQGAVWTMRVAGAPRREGIAIRGLASEGGFPRINGSGRLDARHLLLDLKTIQSPAFTGGIRVNLPFDAQRQAPLEVDVQSEFLSREALPEHMTFLETANAAGSNAHAAARPWVLRGAFRHLQWDAASMDDVRVRFASSAQGVGTLQAARLRAANLSASKVHGYFRLPGKGVVDIRELVARLPGQDVRVSGVLKPEGEGRLRWRGFAVMQGEFSSVIRRLDASGLFRGGRMRAVWSGEGVLSRGKPWWSDLRGHLRLRSDEGRLLVESGTMTKLLAALNLLDLPRFLLGKRKDMSGEGLFYKRLQLEAHVENAIARVDSLAVRASALDMAGRGTVRLDTGRIDLYATVRPLQNLDALLNMIPFLRDILLGPGGSVFRKVYHVHGPLQNAKVEPVDAKAAGLPGGGLIEQLFSLPSNWFGKE